VTVTPTRHESHATITVNGHAVTSGSPSGPISLDVGSNTITTVVTAQDASTTDTYTITVTRASGGGGGGGGGGSSYVPPVVATTTATTTVTTATTTSTTTIPTTTTTTTTSNTTTSNVPVGYQFLFDLGVGSTGNDVIELQRILVEQGFLTMPAGVPMGYYGALTVAAVRAYQAAHGLPQPGVVGPATRASLNGGPTMSISAFINLLINLGIIAPDNVLLVKIIFGLI
jgi:hypothetical protein